MKTKLMRLCAYLLALSLLLAGCNNGGEEPSNPTPAPTPSTAPSTEATEPTVSSAVEHTITLANLAGKALTKVDIRVYADATLTDLIAAGKTDTSGKFSFKRIPSDGYVAVLSKVPTGYGVAPYYELTGEKTSLKLSSADISKEELYNMQFRLGDAMPNFSVSGVDGMTYTLHELLETKKAVVLNFWYMGCDPCKLEFPHIQQAYENYSDEIALLAINPMDSDNQRIARFMQEKGYTFPMLKGDSDWISVFSISAFPLTVVIDRYGNICLTHTGGVPDTATFENMFAYFCLDEYTQEYYKSINLLPKIGE